MKHNPTRDKVLALYAEGLNQTQIADRLNIWQSQVSRYVRGGKAARRRPVNTERHAEVRRLRGEGKTYEEIGDALGITKQAVSLYFAGNNNKPAPRANGHDPVRSPLHDLVLNYARPFIMAEIRERLGT